MRETKVYVVGHNMAGYLPDSDPYYTDDETSAKRYLYDEMDAYGDYLSEAPEDERDERWHEEEDDLSVAMGDLNYHDAPCAWSVGIRRYWIEVTTLGQLMADNDIEAETVKDALNQLNGY